MRTKHIGLFLLLLAGASCQKEKTFTDTFKTAVVEKGNIVNTVTSTGTVEPVNSVDVGTQVSGIIDKIYVDYNSEVKAGQVIAELDKTTLEADLRSAQANLASSKAELTYQKANYDRIKSLYERQVISDVEMEQAQYQYDKAKAAYDKVQADMSRVKKNLDYATIYSPISGVVLYKAVEEGQTVASSFNTPTLFTIAQDLRKMRVIANIDEADIGMVKEGQLVTFTVDAYPNDIFNGKVSQVRLQATTTSNVVTYEVVIDAPNEDLKLKPGLTANITIITEAANDVLMVPVKALSFKPTLPEKPDMPQPPVAQEQPNSIASKRPALQANEKIIFIKDAQGMHPQKVEIGMTNGIYTEIKDGLALGDTIVTDQIAEIDLPAPAGKMGGSPFMPQPPGRNRKR
ncbi:MAG: efflux RND transporter periplasmic adaptor subunit [Paludibacteraceae bacterium]|nr:efflux RND transporter periplasmic adaptor subunit [Paludibacteraceae bacterium]